MKKLVILIVSLGFIFASNAQAEYRRGYDNYDDHFHQRQERQNRRINRGIRNGVLTRREIEKLRCEQEEIARLEHRFLRDGWFSDRERRKLQRRLNKASNRIYKYKHNGRYSRKSHYNDYDHDDYNSRRYRGSGVYIGGRNGSFNVRW